MKILFLNQTYHPDKAGTAQQLTRLATDLVGFGHSVTVVCARRSYEDPTVRYAKKESIEGVQLERVGSTGWGKRSFFHRLVDGVTFELALVWKLFGIGRQDVVVSFTSPPLIGLVGTLFARRWGAANIQWLMDIHPNVAIAVGYLHPWSPVSGFLLRVLRYILRRSDSVIVLDRFMKRVAVANGAKAEVIQIIPPGLPEGMAIPDAPPGHSNPFRTNHDLENKFVVLYSGNHSIVHPLDTLLEAARELRDEDHIRFLFVGEGLRKQDVSVFRERHGLSNILELPYQPKEVLPESLATGDLHVVILGDRVNGLVHPSKIYGVMGVGRPYLFIGAEASHIGELMKNFPGGVRADHGKSGQVAMAIREVASRSEKDRRSMGQINLNYLRQHCQTRNCTELFQRLVLEPLSAKGAIPAAGLRSSRVG